MKFEVIVYCLIDESVSFDVAPLAIKFHEGENVSIDFRRNCFLIYLLSHNCKNLKINKYMMMSIRQYIKCCLEKGLSMSINVSN